MSSQAPSGGGHRFGGGWTERKLQVLAGYLAAYTTALRNKPTPEAPFRKTYIDAFAGTGYRITGDDPGETELSIFHDLVEDEPQSFLDGSARLALRTKPRFDRYIFIERNLDRFRDLQNLTLEFPKLALDVDIRHGDANLQLRDLCGGEWRSRRAVLLLDPYGMQVEWETIEAVASTRAIDMWLLFPLGIGVNRLLTRSGDIPASWRTRLNKLLGTDDWYEAFYQVQKTPSLFGEEHESVVKKSVMTIGRYFNERLSSIFAGVAPNPGILRNSRNNPLYLFCFAVGNERGKGPALRIANHLLKDLQ